MFKSLIYLRFGHILLDLVLINLSFILAYFIRVGFIFSTDFLFVPYALTSVVASFFWISFLLFARYYKIPPRSGKKLIYDLMLISIGGIVAVASLILIYYFQRELLPSRLITVYILCLGVFFLFFSGYLFRFILRWQKKKEIRTYKTLVIGANPVTEKLIERVKNSPYDLHTIVGVIDPYGVYKKIEGSVILGKLDKLDQVCKKYEINSILQCDAYEQAINVISFCEEKNIKYQSSLFFRGIFEENIRIRDIAGKTVMSYVKRDFSEKNKKTKYKVVDAVLNQVFDLD